MNTTTEKENLICGSMIRTYPSIFSHIITY